MDTRMYVMTHKEYQEPEDKLYISLHVGHALAKEKDIEFGYEGDDTGDNISFKNANYCELTGIYWLWKNIQCDAIGITHYRRYFVEDGKLVDQIYVEQLLQKYDVIIPACVTSPYDNMYEQYSKNHYEKDLLICRDVIAEIEPEYLDAFDYYFSCNLMSMGNMMIVSKSIFNQYCEWVFRVLFEMEKRVDIKDYDFQQGRIFGYISERLLRIWLMKQSFSIYEQKVEMRK